MACLAAGQPACLSQHAPATGYADRSRDRHTTAGSFAHAIAYTFAHAIAYCRALTYCRAFSQPFAVSFTIAQSFAQPDCVPLTYYHTVYRT